MRIFSIYIEERAITKYNGNMTSRQGGIFLTPKVKNFENAVRYAASKQFLGEPLKGKLKVDIDFYFNDNKMPDLFNLPKAVCDALNTKKGKGVNKNIIRPGVWLDDRQIISGSLNKHGKSGKNAIIIKIEELE